MKKAVLALALTLMMVSTSFAATLVYEKAGFEIDLLDSTPPATGAQPLVMLLPGVNGFAANVNVQLQPYEGSLAEFKKLTEDQFSQYGFTVVTSEDRKDSLLFEYRGLMNNRELHWYAKAYRSKGFIYLVTATSEEAAWAADKAKMMSTVDSFRVLPSNN